MKRDEWNLFELGQIEFAKTKRRPTIVSICLPPSLVRQAQYKHKTLYRRLLTWPQHKTLYRKLFKRPHSKRQATETFQKIRARARYATRSFSDSLTHKLFNKITCTISRPKTQQLLRTRELTQQRHAHSQAPMRADLHEREGYLIETTQLVTQIRTNETTNELFNERANQLVAWEVQWLASTHAQQCNSEPAKSHRRGGATSLPRNEPPNGDEQHLLSFHDVAHVAHRNLPDITLQSYCGRYYIP